MTPAHPPSGTTRESASSSRHAVSGPGSTAPGSQPTPPADVIVVTVNGQKVVVPRLMPDWTGKLAPTTMLQACGVAKVDVPHYCYHPRLPVAGNCRMCLVEYGTPVLGPDRHAVRGPDGEPVINKSPRPAIACATPVTSGMAIYTDTPGVKHMREGVLEFLLANHPLDCPICDEAGECRLQEYAVDYGQSASRFVETKVHKPKQVDLGPRIVLDDERCILCTRCIRFTRDLAGDDALGIVNRGSYSTLTHYPGRPFDNNYSLNTVDLCPVGALTSKDFRFQMRVWFLRETKGVCTSCGTGCNILIGSRENRVLRFTPRDNGAVNGSWMCDTGRLNYKWIHRPDRIVKLGGSRLPAPTWPAALAAVASALRNAPPSSVAIVASARQTNEELYLLRKLAQRLGAASDSVPRAGEADRWLVSADRNPNSAGARLFGLAADPMGSNVARFAQGIRTGSLRTLLVLGEDVTRCGLGADLLAKIETLIVSDVLPNPTTALAHYLLPGCAAVEKRGSFTNAHGRVQRFFAAIDPPGDARPEWELLRDLVMAVTDRALPDTIEGLFNQMAGDVRALHGIEWAALGDAGLTVPMQSATPDNEPR